MKKRSSESERRPPGKGAHDLRWWRTLLAVLTGMMAGVMTGSSAGAAQISWKGHSWQGTSGGMAGVCRGDPGNVTVDADGYLHLRITNTAGTWTAAELF